MATCKDFDTGSDQITKLCNLCDSNVSDGYCDECEDHMCQSCFEIHSRARICRHHVLLNDVCQKDKKKAYSKPCKRHPNQFIKFYCVAHKIVGCVECFFPEHRNCNYQNIEDAAKIFQDSGEDTRLQREIHVLENTHNEYTRHLKEHKETIAVINSTVAKDVKSFTDSVTSYVAQVVKHTLEKSDSLHIENETRLERRTDDLDSVGTEIEKCKMKLEKQDCVDRLFISAIEIGPVIEKLRKKIDSIGRQHVVRKYEFQPNNLIVEMMNGSGSFGEVCILPDAETDLSNMLTVHQSSSIAKDFKINDERKKTTTGVVDRASAEIKTPSDANMHSISLRKKTFMVEDISVMVYKASIIGLDVDCIVNAANSQLQHGAGVARAIAKAAGRDFEDESKQYISDYGKLYVGQACSTTAGKLNYRCVIHVAGPAWYDYETKSYRGRNQCNYDLKQAVLNSFYEAENLGLKSIALPPISSASFGVPIEVCVKQYVRAVKEYCNNKRGDFTSALSEIHFIDVNERTVCAIQSAFKEFLDV